MTKISTNIPVFAENSDRQLIMGQPLGFNTTAEPLQLWIIQLGIIISTANLLSLVLRKMHQPKVIAEVLGGILLGPTFFGRISGFTENIFPKTSLAYLSLTADIGLCLFLFLVGLEIDGSVVKKNLRLSATIIIAGMVVPFIIGAGISLPLYEQYISKNIEFVHFMFFTGVAFSVTAFPVLCRILTELKILDTTVGTAVLSAGVGNDIVGWGLLALSVAMVQASTVVTALNVVVGGVGWTLFLLFPVKHALRRLAKHTGSIEDGPTVLFMTVTMLILFISVFFTDIIGVHAIFGAFLAGVIVPREDGLAISLVEKLEDMVEIIFLPLYFAILGMSTDLGLLDDGITWAYTIAIILAAFISKFSACAFAARYTAGFSWRESGAIGSLMSCKGLVELIVLEVGLSAGVFTPRLFTMFVLESLILTFATTPLVTCFYPSQARKRTSSPRDTFSNIVVDELYRKPKPRDFIFKTRFTLVLDKLEHLPGAMALSQLIGPPVAQEPSSKHLLASSSSGSSVQKQAPISIEVLRLIELSDRQSAVMKSHATHTTLKADPLLAVYKMFSRLNGLNVTSVIDTVTSDNLVESVLEHAHSYASDMILLPWIPPSIEATSIHAISEDSPTHLSPAAATRASNTVLTESSSKTCSRFLQGVFSRATIDVAALVDRTIDGVASKSGNQHLFLPFFGGPDDRLALEFVVQVCEKNEKVSATVLRMGNKDLSLHPLASGTDFNRANSLTELSDASSSSPANPDTAQILPVNEADKLSWEHFASLPLPRIQFKECATRYPLRSGIRESEKCKRTGIRLLIVVGRRRDYGGQDYVKDLKELSNEYGIVMSEVKETVGSVGSAFVAACSGDGVIVLQTANIAVN